MKMRGAIPMVVVAAKPTASSQPVDPSRPLELHPHFLHDSADMIFSILLPIALASVQGAPSQNSALSPQQPGVENTTTWLSVQKSIPWNPLLTTKLGSPSFESLLLTDVNGDLEFDACTLSSGELFLTSHLASLQVVGETDLNMPDMDSMAVWGRGADGGAELLVSTPSGLSLVRFAVSIFSSQPVDVTPQAGTALMKNAKQLRTAVLGGVPHIVGISVAGNEIISMYESEGAWVAGPSWFLGRPVQNFDFTQYDGDGQVDLIVGTLPISAAIAQDGSVLYAKSDPSASFVVDVQNGEGGSLDRRMAKIVQTSTGEWMLEHFDATQSDPPLLLEFPRYAGGTPEAIVPVGVVAEDLDLDGYDELILLLQESRRLVVLLNLGEAGAAQGAQFATDNALFLSMDESNTNQSNGSNVCWPVAGDFDGDGNPDVLVTDQYGERMLIFDNLGLLPFNIDSLKVQDSPSEAAVLTGFVSDQSKYFRPTGTRALQFAFESLPTYLLNTYSHIQVKVYILDPLSGTIDLDPKVNAAYKLNRTPGSSGEQNQFCSLENTEAFPLTGPNGSVDLPWEGSPTDPRTIVIYYRGVNLGGPQGDDIVMPVSVPFTAAFTMQADMTDPATIDLQTYFSPLVAESESGDGFLVSQGDLSLSSAALNPPDETYVGALVGDFLVPPPSGPVGPTQPKNLDEIFAELW